MCNVHVSLLFVLLAGSIVITTKWKMHQRFHLQFIDRWSHCNLSPSYMLSNVHCSILKTNENNGKKLTKELRRENEKTVIHLYIHVPIQLIIGSSSNKYVTLTIRDEQIAFYQLNMLALALPIEIHIYCTPAFQSFSVFSISSPPCVFIVNRKCADHKHSSNRNIKWCSVIVGCRQCNNIFHSLHHL